MKFPRMLVLSEKQHKQLMAHLFSGDGLESAAILLCGRCGEESRRLTVSQIILVPHHECRHRTPSSLIWPGSYLEEAIDAAEPSSHSIILMHSHPSHYSDFSATDDESDHQTIPCLQHGLNSIQTPHGSAIMVPSGRINARLYNPEMVHEQIDRVLVVGECITDHTITSAPKTLPFSSQMADELSTYTVCIIGLSGTGSITAELLARLGVGHLILIDFDRVEHKNLNRILYSTLEDANNREFKTVVLKRAIQSHHPQTKVTTIERSIAERESLIAASDADFIFSCVDSTAGRYYCDLMAPSFMTPLIDMGVTIPTRKSIDKTIEIADVLGRIDYVFPGGPGLLDRNTISPEGLRAEYLAEADSKSYQRQVNEGYINGKIEEAPSVISLNMRAASAAVNELLSRMYSIREGQNSSYAQTLFSLSEPYEEYQSTQSYEYVESSLLGRGLMEPLLGLPQFTDGEKAA